MTHNRIDVHQHIVPPFWAKRLEDSGGDPSGWKSPDWSPEQAIAFIDSLEIKTGILSLTAPSILGWKGQERVKMALRVNDYGVDLVRENPQRFGYFATLPLPEIDATLTEIERAFDVMQVDGVVLLSNYDGKYLADFLFEPVWEELDRRGAVVFIHPTMPPMPALKNIPAPIADFPADTTRTALDLLVAGHLSRFRKVKIILSHAGGYLPYCAKRFVESISTALDPSRTTEALVDDLQQFYFDTALSAPDALPSLFAFASPGHVLFGSDFPYAPVKAINNITECLDSYQGFGCERIASIAHSAAEPLFPRLRELNRR